MNKQKQTRKCLRFFPIHRPSDEKMFNLTDLRHLPLASFDHGGRIALMPRSKVRRCKVHPCLWPWDSKSPYEINEPSRSMPVSHQAAFHGQKACRGVDESASQALAALLGLPIPSGRSIRPSIFLSHPSILRYILPLFSLLCLCRKTLFEAWGQESLCC